MNSSASIRQQGFTLLEVLVALGITAILGIIAYGGLNSAMSVMEDAEKQNQRLNDVNILFSILSRDLRQIVPRTIRDDYGSREHAFDAPEGELYALQFSRTGWQNPRPDKFIRSSMQRVRYLLEEEKLMRESWYVMDRVNDSKSVKVAIVDGVRNLKLRFLEPPPVPPLPIQPDAQWRETWPYPYPVAGGGAAVSDRLPLAVEITLDLAGWGEIRRIFELPEND